MTRFADVLKSRLSGRPSGPYAHKDARGVTLIEALMGVAILGATYFGLTQVMGAQAMDIKGQVAAQQLKVIQAATQRYIRDNYNDLSDDGAAEINHATLFTQGYLPPTYAEDPASPTTIRANPWGQEYRLLYNGNGTEVQAVVLTNPPTASDGQQIPAGELGGIAQLMGADGGFYCAANPTGTYSTVGVCRDLANASVTNTAIGAHGGWEIDMAQFSGISGLTIRQGGLAAAASFGDDQVLNDYLYRYDIGVPAANQMFTELEMNNQGIIFNTDDTGGGTTYTIGIGDANDAAGIGGDENSIVLHADGTTANPHVLIDANGGGADAPRINLGDGTGTNLVEIDGSGFIQMNDPASPAVARMDFTAINLADNGAAPANQFYASGSNAQLILRRNNVNELEYGTGILRHRRSNSREFLYSNASNGELFLYDNNNRARVQMDSDTGQVRAHYSNGSTIGAMLDGNNGRVDAFDTSGRVRARLNGATGDVQALDTSGRVRSELASDGNLNAYDTSNRVRSRLNGSSGYVETVDTSGRTRARLDSNGQLQSIGTGNRVAAQLNQSGNAGYGRFYNSGGSETITLDGQNGALSLTGQFRINSNNLIFTDLGNAPASQLFSNYIFKEAWYVNDGQFVAKPSCRSGWTPKVYIDGAATKMKIGNWANYADFVLYANNSGNNWQIRVQTRGQSSYGFHHGSANVGFATYSGGTAVVRTYCYRRLS